MSDAPRQIPFRCGTGNGLLEIYFEPDPFIPGAKVGAQVVSGHFSGMGDAFFEASDLATFADGLDGLMAARTDGGVLAASLFSSLPRAGLRLSVRPVNSTGHFSVRVTMTSSAFEDANTAELAVRLEYSDVARLARCVQQCRSIDGQPKIKPQPYT